MLGLKLNHVSKRGPWRSNLLQQPCLVIDHRQFWIGGFAHKWAIVPKYESGTNSVKGITNDTWKASYLMCYISCKCGACKKINYIYWSKMWKMKESVLYLSGANVKDARIFFVLVGMVNCGYVNYETSHLDAWNFSQYSVNADHCDA